MYEYFAWFIELFSKIFSTKQGMLAVILAAAVIYLVWKKCSNNKLVMVVISIIIAILAYSTYSGFLVTILSNFVK